MVEIHVEVQDDYLQRIANVKKPILAVSELVWNSLDADATEIRIEFNYNTLGGLESIRVEDNGHGIDYIEAIPAFKNLGGSWKKSRRHSKQQHRIMHGSAGKGRFRAFALGQEVTWRTKCQHNGGIVEYEITGNKGKLGTFSINDPIAVTDQSTGTIVIITDINKNFPSLNREIGLNEITIYFALYLSQYANVHIWYDGVKIDPKSVQELKQDYELNEVVIQKDRILKLSLTVIEWKTDVGRSLFLCNSSGFALAEVPPGIQAPGFYFTAYLKGDILEELDERNALDLNELDPDLRVVLNAAKDKLKEHFRKRSAERATKLVEQWKEQDVYPYKGEPVGIIEEAERQVFDVLAFNLNEYMPEFEDENLLNKRLSFRLLKSVLRESPRALQQIIGEVLVLPLEKQEELAELLERTSLAAIINASKVVADRLDFIRALEIMLFDESNRRHFKERSQLHKLLENATWLFGEEYSLTVSDKSLSEVLKRHIQLLGREELTPDPEPVLTPDGKIGIVDLMLSRLKTEQGDNREHLVVELKRPSQLINAKILLQVEDYAFAVAGDERFKDTDTKWVFWAISNDITEDVRKRARQYNKPPGLVYESDDTRILIWVKSWGEVLQNCNGRLRFFKEHLDYSPDDESALAKLRKMHEKYLPKST